MPTTLFLRSLLVAALGVLATMPARAMSVVPPTFAELVAEAELVVRGVVTEVRTEEFDSPDGRGVRTLVTLRVERALKGSPGESVTLTILGGTVGRRTLSIPGMPQFRVGQRQVVFVAQNGRVFCPLVRIGHGRYHLRHDDATGRDYVARDNDVPLTSTDEVALPLANAALVARTRAPAAGLAPADFEARITAVISAQAAAPR